MKFLIILATIFCFQTVAKCEEKNYKPSELISLLKIKNSKKFFSVDMNTKILYDKKEIKYLIGLLGNDEPCKYVKHTRSSTFPLTASKISIESTYLLYGYLTNNYPVFESDEATLKEARKVVFIWLSSNFEILEQTEQKSKSVSP